MAVSVWIGGQSSVGFSAPPPLAPDPGRYGFALKGFNFGDTTLPGHLYGEVQPATQNAFAYAARRGYGFVRLELLWERLQRDLFGELGCTFDLYSVNLGDPKADLFVLLENQFGLAKQYGLKVLPTIMNYGARALYTGGAWTLAAQGAYAYRSRDRKFPIGSAEVPIAAFADFWGRFAAMFQPGGRLADYHDTLLGLELMNEPTQLADNGTTNGQMSQAAITAIRAAGYTGLIYINGDHYADTRSWIATNAGALDALEDPVPNKLIAVGHYYPDSDHSGTYKTTEAARPNAGMLLNRGITENANWDAWWATKPQNFVGRFLGEFGIPYTSEGNYWEEIARRTLVYFDSIGVGINLEGAWPEGSDANINVLPVPFDMDAERGLVKILTSLRQKTDYAAQPIGLGDIVVAGLAGNKVAGAAFAGAATNFTAGSVLAVTVKSYIGDLVAGPLLTGNESGGYSIAGNWPATGDIYALTVTETRGALVKTTVYPVNVVAAASPVNRAVPAISGPANVGQAQAGTTGVWSNAPTSFDYKRQRDGADIAGTSGTVAAGTAIPAYLYVSADQGHQVRLAIRASNAAGAGEWAYSDAVTVGAVIADTMADVVGATLFENRVFDMNVATAPQVIPNAIPAPSDGSAKAAYDLMKGITSANESQDPTYVAAAGGLPAMLRTNGSQYCEAPFTPFTQNLGNNLEWSFVGLYLAPADWGTTGLPAPFTFGGNASSQPGVQLRWDAANKQWQLNTVGGGVGRRFNMNVGADLPTAGLMFVVMCWKPATRSWKLYVNSAAPVDSSDLHPSAATSTTAVIGSSVVADTSLTPRYVFGQAMPNGTGLIVPGAIIPKIVTNEEVAEIAGYLNTKLGIVIPLS